MFESSSSMSDTRRFLLAAGGALLFSLACLSAALGPADALCFCKAGPVSLDRPTLL